MNRDNFYLDIDFLKNLYIIHKDLTNVKYKLINKDFTSILESRFMPLNIKSWIIKNYNKCINFKVLNFTIYIYFIEKNNININLIKLIIKWMNKIFSFNKSSNVELYIFPTPFKKELPKNKLEPLTPYNINSGYTDTKNIIIFRHEELYKVLIHEIIHTLNIDYKHNDHLFNVEHIQINNISVNEAITETITMYLHTLLYSYINENNLYNNYLLEVKYTESQIIKILKHYNMNFKDIFNINNFIQDTNVFSYFILKYLFMLNIKSFLKCFLLRDREKFIKYINNELIKLNKINIDNTDSKDSSLRMTIQDLE